MVERTIDLRSDTVTVPTEKMRRAMATAEVGDDVYGEDPTINRLEERAAQLLDKEAALFVASGTMGNQAAVMTHTEIGDEIILEQDAHIYYYEAGGPARLAGVQVRPLPSQTGVLDPGVVERAIRPQNIHFPNPALLCLENTHNRGGGVVTSVEDTEKLCRVAHENGLRVHLDGARVFNAATALGVEAAELVAPVDSVMFCLSKGLAAPVGSLLVGSEEFIAEARGNRKVLGGGMRQAGILAAAGLVALDEMVDRLQEDHDNARYLAEGLAEIEGVDIDPQRVETNLVRFEVGEPFAGSDDFLGRLRERGVLAGSPDPGAVRMVTHKDVSRQDISDALATLKDVSSSMG